MTTSRALRASSWSPIDGDAALRYPQVLALHILRRLEAFVSRGALPDYRPFRPLEPVVIGEAVKHSPTRQINIAFLQAFDFPWLQRQLGPLHVLDIGCGAGGYADRFLAADVASYHGVDVAARETWAAADASRVTFQTVECGKEPLTVPGRCNVVFSQSALEHIRWDLSLMEDVARHCRNAGHPVVQLHLVPAAASISLYGAHGWRVYAAAQVARLAAPFAQAQAPLQAQVRVYGMGNRRTRALQYRRFADNRLLRVLAEPFVPYRRDETASDRVAPDRAGPVDAHDADFLALVIATGLRLPETLVRGAG